MRARGRKEKRERESGGQRFIFLLLCDFVRYCQAGECKCPTHMRLATDKRRCEHLLGGVHVEDVDKSHGGEVALGILFALALVAAAVGWFFVYQLRSKGKYSRVLGHAEETNNFLSDTD